MRLLAIDTALDACAAAIAASGEGAPVIASVTEVIGRGHAERLMAVIDRALAAAGIGFADLDRVAVTVGPGSFTGIRVGLAVARGIGLAAGVPVVGVTTLEALAIEAAGLARLDGAAATAICAALDARRGEVYCQLFDADGLPASEAMALPVEAGARLAAAQGAALIGSGARLLVEAWPDMPPPRVLSDAAFAAIETIAGIGLARAPAASAPKPLYVRAPDAKLPAAGPPPRSTQWRVGDQRP